MVSTTARVSVSRPSLSVIRVQWLGYCALVAVMVTYYLAVFLHGAGAGVDFACFRAASLVMAHGGNPYDFAQLWHVEDSLYNGPTHLRPGSPTYYGLDRYYNPPIFATALTPLARLPFVEGYAIYATIALTLAAAGAWLVLLALGWTRRRLPAVVLTLVCPCVFLTIWNGQQSTLLLFALGAALYALRRGYPGLAGTLIAMGWVKPHLLIPIALIAPVLLAPRGARRWYAGFGTATLCGVLLTFMTSGPASLFAWLHTLFGYTGYVDAIQTYLPSLAGMVLVLAQHPWNRSLAIGVTVFGIVVMAVIVARARHHKSDPIATIGLLMATWLLFTPFAHANDDILLLPALVSVWGREGANGQQPLPILTLWVMSILPLSFLLPEPWKLLGVVPIALVFAAAATAESREPNSRAISCANPV